MMESSLFSDLASLTDFKRLHILTNSFSSFTTSLILLESVSGCFPSCHDRTSNYQLVSHLNNLLQLSFSLLMYLAGILD